MQKYYCSGMSFYGDKIPLKFYNNDKEDTLFSALYFENDYKVFKLHKGRRMVFFNGSDVSRLLCNTKWIEIIQNYPAEHYCHNKQLQDELKSVGIDATIVPLFFGNKEDYQVCYKPSTSPRIFMNAHPGREQEYGVDKCLQLAINFEEYEFHIYGIDGENKINVIYHGQIPEAQMDEEIRNYQAVLRFNEHDGMSQIVAKASLLGLYPIVTNDINIATDKLESIGWKPYTCCRNCIKDIKEFLEMIE